jgi:hypothetical protein
MGGKDLYSVSDTASGHSLEMQVTRSQPGSRVRAEGQGPWSSAYHLRWFLCVLKVREPRVRGLPCLGFELLGPVSSWRVSLAAMSLMLCRRVNSGGATIGAWRGPHGAMRALRGVSQLS